MPSPTQWIEEFYKEAKKWSSGQTGACMCLGNCEKCGFHRCHGCLCHFVRFFEKLLAERDADMVRKIENLDYERKYSDTDKWRGTDGMDSYDLALSDVVELLQARK